MSAKPKLPSVAMVACAEYERWSREVPRLTSAIGACACPKESWEMVDQFDDMQIAEPSCFRAACRERVRGQDYGIGPSSRGLRLEEIATRVAGCPECSRLARLVGERKRARKRLGAAKREIRRVGKLVEAIILSGAPLPVPPTDAIAVAREVRGG